MTDALGTLKRFWGPSRCREILRAAASRQISVLGIRAVAAGALCNTIDRPMKKDDPHYIDWLRATKFRALANNWIEGGVSAAYLAHRYALSMEGVASVVLGVKNRVELDECVQAAKDGRLTKDEIAQIDLIMISARM